MTDKAPFDSFFLLWALSLQVVRDQWKRVIFMQTNREDVGDRYKEIVLPIPPDRKTAKAVSKEFRDYFTGLSRLRTSFAEHLAADGLHHFTLTGGEAAEEADPDEFDAFADLTGKLMQVSKTDL